MRSSTGLWLKPDMHSNSRYRSIDESAKAKRCTGLIPTDVEFVTSAPVALAMTEGG